MTYSLADGALEVKTTIGNLSAEAMSLTIICFEALTTIISGINLSHEGGLQTLTAGETWIESFWVRASGI
jgi:hypothetical protein